MPEWRELNWADSIVPQLIEISYSYARIGFFFCDEIEIRNNLLNNENVIHPTIV